MLEKAYLPADHEDPTTLSGATPGKPQLPKAYVPSDTEDRIYTLWEKNDCFKADAQSKKEAFSISMPPPNATGQLHLGHAVMLALEDIFTRFARMQGKEALWVPGTDHAAIATESVVIRNLQKGGMADPRKQLGREKLVAEIAAFVETSRDTIRGQVRKMGSSCDWTRERYTMDPALNRCVNEVFKLMYDDGLIYRGHRIVNWDPKLQTTVSDDEMDYKEETAPFYTFQYGPFQIGTSRPETKFGDKYVVMHPDDERYAQYKNGDTFTAEWINGPVEATVIKDASVDPAFGTGVMTITPWHDATDFEIAERHGLSREQVIDYNGKLLPIAEEFAGMSIEDARPLIVEKLKTKGLLVKADENYLHNKAVNSRGGGTIEPQIKLQWFIDVNKPALTWKNEKKSLKQVLQDVVSSELIEIIPERFEKTYFHWIDNLRDWCISRQIWWGHRVPVWYCFRCSDIYAFHLEPGENPQIPSMQEQLQKGINVGDTSKGIHVSINELNECPKCGGLMHQDEDTLDTWFSSALWTWSTLIDPDKAADQNLSFKQLFEQSADFQKFHPTTVMETGYDILFFWVARMILMTTYTFQKLEIGVDESERIPFKAVYLHGLIRARDGRKMSKSHPETMIDPLDMITKYGADALRLSMIVGQSPGNDSRLYEEKIAGYRNFVNKLWNASRFILLQCEQAGIDPHADLEFDVHTSSLVDRGILSSFQFLIYEVDENLKTYHLSEAGEKLYSFVWNELCDWYLELSKGEANIAVLLYLLRNILKLLHPYCPFVTEELWEHCKPEAAPLLIQEAWPQTNPKLKFPGDQLYFKTLIEVITAIRRLRVEHEVPLDAKLTVTLVTKMEDIFPMLESQAANIRRMARVETLIVSKAPPTGEIVSAFLQNTEVHISLEGLIDKEKEKESLLKEQANLLKFVTGIETKLGNQQFVEKAPPALIEEQKKKLAEAKEKLGKIEEKLKNLS